MSGNQANTTIADLGHWHMLWGNGGGFYHFQLDIVGFLAVLGESSVTANAQVSALSRLFYLPRLLPAPQALLPPSRPSELPSRRARVTGVHTGNNKEHVHHIANILLGQELPTFTVRCVKVTKPDELKLRPTRMDTIFKGVQKKNKSQSSELLPPSIKAKATGPLSAVTLTGFFLSVSLFMISFILGDGYSMIATLLLSFLSTLIGIANKWHLKLAKRPTGSDPDRGDTVIRYPNGSFLVVKCDDDIARELYFAPEEIEYDIKSLPFYRIISLMATLILMLGIIFLANAKLQLQFAWAGSYGIINAAHWAAAALPAKVHWDLSCYKIEEQSVAGGPTNKTFTEALWKAILITKSKEWVTINEAAPQTPTWEQWLDKAEMVSWTVDKIETGPLINPIPEWNMHTPPKGGTVWLAPKDWDAKAAWDKFDRENKLAKKLEKDGGVRGSQTV